MSAILSADDLNDFISPGVACIKPVETLPKRADQDSNSYEVTTEDHIAAANAPPAQISLTDCLACSGCVTSAEAVLVSLQSHSEVLNTLDAYPSLDLLQYLSGPAVSSDPHQNGDGSYGKLFVATVSPQARANLAAAYGVSEKKAGHMIEQLLCGEQGLRAGGRHGTGFTWMVDSNAMRDICLEAVVQETNAAGANSKASVASNIPRKPILASACPGWICYAEKTHPHILPHLSRLKSPQALTGTLIKSVLSKKFDISPNLVWHLAVMPCFDKKLEASRAELTDTYWTAKEQVEGGVRDVDCVITARELLMLADSRGIVFGNLPQAPIARQDRIPFPDDILDRFLFPRGRRRKVPERLGGSSGGYAYYIIQAGQAANPGSNIKVERGRNADVVDYKLTLENQIIMRTARYYGFRNIQNLVRRLKPPKTSRMPGGRLAAIKRSESSNEMGALAEYAYVEVMACPGGCTNGGGQIRASDMTDRNRATEGDRKTSPTEQKQWLGQVDEAYFSGESGSEAEDGVQEESEDLSAGKPAPYPLEIMNHWSICTGVDLRQLLYTSYREVISDVGKDKGSDIERVAGLASSIGGGW